MSVVRNRRFAALAAVLAVATLGACTAQSPDASTSSSTTTSTEGAAPGETNRAVFSNVGLPSNLDPALAASSDGFLFVRNVYEGLTAYEPGTTTIVPALATEWTVSDDGLVYTFTLRDDVTYHDGTPFTAETARLGFERLRAVNGAPATMMSEIESIEAVGEYELAITIAAPNGFFTGVLPKLPLASPAAVEANKTADDEWATDWFASNAAGTGPYRLTSFTVNQDITLTANEDYYLDFDPQAPTDIVLRMDPDVTTALQMLGAGDIDMLGAVGPDDSAAAAELDGVKLVEQPSLQVQTIYMHAAKGPLTDPRVREAISLAFNYDAMIDFYEGSAVKANGALPATFAAGLETFDDYTQDLDRARALMEEAGYGDGGLTMRYVGIKGLSYFEFAGTLLADSLANIGIEVTQDLVPTAQLLEAIASEENAPEFILLNTSPVTNNPTAFLRQFYVVTPEEGGFNASWIADDALVAQLDKISGLPEGAEQEAAVLEANQMVKDLHLGIHIAQPVMAQPVRDNWDVTYENLDYLYVVRFFYARNIA